MTVQLNHSIVSARDSKVSARFLAEILGLPPPTHLGPFQVVDLDNGVSLDFTDTVEDFIVERKYSVEVILTEYKAFLISEPGFDEIFARIRDRGLTYWADPGRARPSEINHRDGGRGVYFEDPNGHFLEILTAIATPVT